MSGGRVPLNRLAASVVFGLKRLAQHSLATAQGVQLYTAALQSRPLICTATIEIYTATALQSYTLPQHYRGIHCSSRATYYVSTAELCDGDSAASTCVWHRADCVVVVFKYALNFSFLPSTHQAAETGAVQPNVAAIPVIEQGVGTSVMPAVMPAHTNDSAVGRAHSSDVRTQFKH